MNRTETAPACGYAPAVPARARPAYGAGRRTERTAGAPVRGPPAARRGGSRRSAVLFARAGEREPRAQPDVKGAGQPEPHGGGRGELLARHAAVDAHDRLADDDDGAVVVGGRVGLQAGGVAVP